MVKKVIEFYSNVGHIHFFKFYAVIAAWSRKPNPTKKAWHHNSSSNNT